MPEKWECSLKILITSMFGVGHLNACLGIGRLLVKRGHSVYFAFTSEHRVTIESQGIEFILLTDYANEGYPIKTETSSDLIFFEMTFEQALKHPPLEQMKQLMNFDGLDGKGRKSGQDGLLEHFGVSEGANYALINIVNQLKPDVCLADYLFPMPWMLTVDVPTIPVMSLTPLELYKGPPLGSGFSVNDSPDLWDQFAKQREAAYGKFFGELKRLYDRFNVKFSPNGDQKYFGIYIYPGPLDYVELGPPKANWIRLDSSIRKPKSESFTIPEKIASLPGKLIYLSMGTLASRVTELMDMIITPLAKSPHRFIISTGPKGETIKLSDNMWGDKFVNQIAILPQVDLFITHGGSNSLIEGLSAGKPLLVIPLFVDQYDNAQRVVDLNLGSRLNLWEFSGDKLIGTIDHVLNNQLIATNVQRVAQEMKKSDSSDLVCSAIEQLAITKISPIKH